MTKLRRAHWIAIGVVLYLALGIGSMLVRSPFAVAVEEACEMGDWRSDQVTFLSGSYGFRLFYSVADAQLRVQTEQGAVPVRIELRSQSRYELHENNSYGKGLVNTLVTDTIGTGPRLQVTVSESCQARKSPARADSWRTGIALLPDDRSTTWPVPISGVT